MEQIVANHDALTSELVIVCVCVHKWLLTSESTPMPSQIVHSNHHKITDRLLNTWFRLAMRSHAMQSA